MAANASASSGRQRLPLDADVGGELPFPGTLCSVTGDLAGVAVDAIAEPLDEHRRSALRTARVRARTVSAPVPLSRVRAL